MSFDKDLFLKYIKEEMKEGENPKYLAARFYRLYKTYNLINLTVEKKGKKEIERLEDYIYTVDNVVLSDKERIILEFSNIKENVNNHEDEKLRNEINLQLESLEKELEDLDLTDKTVIHYFKKNISVLQATLGLESTFLQAAFDAFLELYRNMRINILPKNNYKLFRNSEQTQTEKIKLENFEIRTR